MPSDLIRCGTSTTPPRANGACAYAKALDYFVRDFKWSAERHGDNETRIVRYSVGNTYRAIGRVDEPLKLQQDLVKALSVDGYAHGEIAEYLLELGRIDEARLSFARAFDLLSKGPRLAANEPRQLTCLKRLAQKHPR
jgi:tetratricopeptide (TPR) repeat protein